MSKSCLGFLSTIDFKGCQRSADQTHISCVPVTASPGFKPEGRVGVKSGCSGVLKPDMLALSGKANKCSDAGTGDLGVLTTRETSQPMVNAASRQEDINRWQVYRIARLAGFDFRIGGLVRASALLKQVTRPLRDILFNY